MIAPATITAAPPGVATRGTIAGSAGIKILWPCYCVNPLRIDSVDGIIPHIPIQVHPGKVANRIGLAEIVLCSDHSSLAH